ncbi:glycosyltransferase [Microbacterium maritypicum]|uniref:glycosyltransferase n=1 Tax=Microbacterium maritypicum TaxID=33918 RepID=UPI0038252DD9
MSGFVGAVALTLSVLFIAYVVLIIVPFLRLKHVDPGESDKYQWHFFIPCRDESAVIGQTISRSRSDFPMAHVWVIDDASVDTTLDIAREAAASDPYVHVVSRTPPNARTGKGDALNDAYAHLLSWLPDGVDRSRVIVMVLDADGELGAGSLDAVSSMTGFGNESVGAVQITVWMKNRDDRPSVRRGIGVADFFSRMLVRMQDLEFRTAIAAMQSLRGKTGSVGLGGNGQFTRLSVLDEIGRQYGVPWHGSLLEDYELGIHVLMAGSGISHVHEAHVSQEALTSFRRLVTQRSRWAQGNIQCFSYLKAIFRSPNFSSAAVLEASYYLVLPFLQLLGILVFLIVGVLTVLNLMFGSFAADTYLRDLPGALLLFVLFSIGPFLVWGPIYRSKCEPGISILTSLGYGLAYWLYVYYMYLVIPRAFMRVLLRRRGWAKTRRNAEEHISGMKTALDR